MGRRLHLSIALLLSGSLLAVLAASDAHAYRMWLEADLDVGGVGAGLELDGLDDLGAQRVGGIGEAVDVHPHRRRTGEIVRGVELDGGCAAGPDALAVDEHAGEDHME